MAKQEQIKKTTGKSPENIVVNQITISPPVRTTQDIAKWRAAIKSAESTIPRRVELYDLFDDIMLDGHLTSVIEKRQRAISNSEWVFQIDKKVDARITKMIQKQWFYDFMADLVDTKFWGHTAFDFNVLNDVIAYELVPRKHVEPVSGLISKQQVLTGDGFRYREEPWTRYIIEAGSKPYMGLLRKAAQYVIYKRAGFGDWKEFADLFGMPFRVAKYDGDDDLTRIQLENALKEAGSAAYAVLPTGSTIEFIQNSSNSGSTTLYDLLIKACNAELSKLFLSNTLTTEQGDKGARSLGDVHMEVEDDVHMADILFVTTFLNNEFKNLLASHGLPVLSGEFTRVEKRKTNLKDRIEIDIKLKNEAKLPMSDDYFYDTYDVPKPENYDQLIEEQKAANPFPPEPQDPQPQPGKKTPPVKKEPSALARLMDIVDFFSWSRLK
ncbi:hypothetical protein SDC9_46861 [bioreactor metagenome]|uniref:DUF935 family protein n=1 Tax=bioreactor metagenome TaxID=1076179 RepID=A0A644WDJ7_9ZZZZ